MTQQLLLDQFETLTEAPNGIPKLRELILQLAVQGKLVPQDPSDEPASVLLEKIKTEKERLIKEGKIKEEKSIAPTRLEETPYEVPGNWEWARFQDICSYIQRGKGPEYVDEREIPVISQKCIQWSGFDISKARFVKPSSLEHYAPERYVRSGDLLWNSTGLGTIGRANVYVREENNYEMVVADSHVTIVRSILMESQFIFNWIASPYVQDEIENLASGSTKQVELNTSTIKQYIIPVAPVKEQKRIVAKVDQLMALCDELEERQSKKKETKLKLNRASLNRLTASRKEDLTANWRNLRDSFTLVYDTPETIPELRQTILQLAVQGKLVPQDPSDEPASVLLERIKAEKERLVKERKLREEKPLPLIADQEIPHKLPEGWIWCRLCEICKLVTDGKHGDCDNQENSGYYFLSAKDIVGGELNYLNARQIMKEDFLEVHKRTNLELGDILLSNAGSIGKIAVAKDKDKVRYTTFQKSVAIIKPVKPFILLSYLVYALSYDIAMLLRIAQGTSVKNLLLRDLKSLKIPLPPSEEQKRIVAKVDQLMALCDELEDKLQRSTNQTQKLLESVAQSASVS